MYSWERVAVRTERIYDAVASAPRDDALLARLGRFHKCVMSSFTDTAEQTINMRLMTFQNGRIIATNESCSMSELYYVPWLWKHLLRYQRKCEVQPLLFWLINVATHAADHDCNAGP